MIADLPGDLAEAGRCEVGRALRHRDMGTGSSKSWFRARTTRAVRLSGVAWVAG